MTANKPFKRRVRVRAARTGESYQAAYHGLLVRSKEPKPMTAEPSRQSVAVAIHTLEADWSLPTAAGLSARRQRIEEMLAEASAAGARLVVFPEGAFGSPGKGVISRSAPTVDEADWSKLDWSALRAELGEIAEAARRYGVWIVIGAPHQLSEGRRPHNSLYVISDAGQVVTRYDKRRLSTTEITHMFTPGTEAITFDVDGIKVGLVVGLEMLFPDLFTDYADRGVDLILACSHGGGIFAQLARSFAAINVVPVALAIPASAGEASAAGVYGWNGPIAVVSDQSVPQTIVTTVTSRDSEPTFHFKARHGFYDTHLAPEEPRSHSRTAF